MAGWVDGSLFSIHFILHWNFIGCSTNSRHLLNIWVSSRADRRPLGTWCWTQPGYSFWLSIYFTVRCLQLHVIPASKEISKDAILVTKNDSRMASFRINNYPCHPEFPALQNVQAWEEAVWSQCTGWKATEMRELIWPLGKWTTVIFVHLITCLNALLIQTNCTGICRTQEGHHC